MIEYDKLKKMLEDAAKHRGFPLHDYGARGQVSSDGIDIDRFITDGGSIYEGEPFHIEMNTSANCQYGYHDWKYYVGFHMERYWFCTRCDEKDHKRPPPPK